MTGWRTVQLGVALELAYGKALPKSVRAEGGLVPVYGSNGVAGSHDEVLVGGPTVIVGRKGSAGAVHYVDGPCYPIDTTYFVRPRAGFDFDMKFLFYLLRKLDLARLRTATGVPGLTREDVYREAVPVPPIEEQRRIVDLLSRAEGIVRLRREAQKKAAEIIPALFLDMFGDPATNPKGWPRVVLEEVAAVGSGNGFPIIHQGKKSGRFPFYKVSDMNLPGNEVEMRRANNYINENDLQTLRARVFRPGTLIFPKIGAAIATNKKRVLTIEACFDNNVMGITPSKRLSSTFLHGLFLWKDISDFASDSNPPSIRKTTVETWEIQLPPNELQEQFAQRVSAIRSAQTLQASATEQAKGTFNSLLSQVFSEDRNSACTHEDEVTA
jgi:type I restriction enzyme S subunit